MDKRQQYELTTEQKQRVRKLCKVLYKGIDRVEYGYFWEKTGNEHTSHRTPTLLAYYKGTKRLRKITDHHIAKHLYDKNEYVKGGYENVFYSSGMDTEYCLIGVDIDCHNGETDGHRALEIAREFLGEYLSLSEPSTHREGLHAYFWLHKDADIVDIDTEREMNARNKQIRNLCLLLNKILSRKLKDAGIQSGLDIKGMPGYWVKYLKKINRGILMKLPRINSEDLDSLPCMDLEHLINVCRPFLSSERNERPSLMINKPRDKHPKETKKNSNILSHFLTEPTPESHNAVYQESDLSRIRDIHDGNKRKIQACCYLSRKLKRLPSLEEFESFYLDNELYTPPLPNNRRLSNLQSAIDYVAQTFNPTKARFTVLDFEECKSLVDEISDSMILECKKKGRRLERDDIAAVLYAHTNINLNDNDDTRKATVPHRAVEDYWEVLQQQGLISKACKREIVNMARAVLIKAELITLLNNNWTPSSFAIDGQGISKRFGLGVAHPLYNEFIEYLNKPQSEAIEIKEEGEKDTNIILANQFEETNHEQRETANNRLAQKQTEEGSDRQTDYVPEKNGSETIRAKESDCDWGEKANRRIPAKAIAQDEIFSEI